MNIGRHDPFRPTDEFTSEAVGEKMRLLLRIFPLVLILAGATLLFERSAYAYADPGTGLLAIQAVGSALIASGWYLRRKIYTLFHRGEVPKAESERLPFPEDSEG
jgi:hypothetical protein